MKKSKNNISFFGKNRSEEFRKENEADITAYENAKKFLDKFSQPLPNGAIIEKSMQENSNEIENLRRSKPETRQRYKEKSAEVKRLETIRKNLYDVLPRTKSIDKSYEHER